MQLSSSMMDVISAVRLVSTSILKSSSSFSEVSAAGAFWDSSSVSSWDVLQKRLKALFWRFLLGVLVFSQCRK